MVTKGKRPFRFEGFWAKELGCREVVENSWCNQIGGDYLNKWHWKKRNSKKNLKMWSRETFQDRKALVNNLTELLGLLHLNWSTNAERIKETTARILELEKQKEAFWAQQSRVCWLQVADSNTAFFHHSTIQRKRVNRISRIKDKNGNWVEDSTGVRRSFEDYFRNLFRSSGNRDWTNLLDCISPSITSKMNDVLTKPIEDDEIHEMAFQMGGSKAPGPDGFQCLLFKSLWDVIYVEVKWLIA